MTTIRILFLASACPLFFGIADLHAQEVTYGDVAAILQSRCVVCHTGPSAPLGLRLDNLDNVLKGSQNGPVAVGGKPEASELIRRLKGVSSPSRPRIATLGVRNG